MKCQCKDCGKTFIKGEEGDNEYYCLRCEYLSTISEGDERESEDE